MSFKLPAPTIDAEREAEIARLISKGLAANRWRKDYEQWAHKRLWAEQYQGAKVTTLKRWCGELEGKRVLDLGTGRGGLAVAMEFAGARVVAMDLRRRNCRTARLRAERYSRSIPATMAVGEALPFGSGTFDLVVCKDVTEHARDPLQLLREIRRVLTPVGAAYVTFINRLAWDDPHYHIPGVNYLPRVLGEMVIRHSGRNKPNIRDLQRLSDMHYVTLSQARRMAATAGLSYHDISAERIDGRFRLLRVAGHGLSLTPGTFEAVLRPKS